MFCFLKKYYIYLNAVINCYYYNFKFKIVFSMTVLLNINIPIYKNNSLYARFRFYVMWREVFNLKYKFRYFFSVKAKFSILFNFLLEFKNTKQILFYFFKYKLLI